MSKCGSSIRFTLSNLLNDESPIDLITGEPEEDLDIWTTDEWMVTQANAFMVIGNTICSKLASIKNTIKAVERYHDQTATKDYMDELKAVALDHMERANSIMTRVMPDLKKKIAEDLNESNRLLPLVANKDYTKGNESLKEGITKNDLKMVILATYDNVAYLSESKYNISNPNISDKKNILQEFSLDTNTFKVKAPADALGLNDVNTMKVLGKALIDTYKYFSETIEEEENLKPVEPQEIEDDDNTINQEEIVIDYDNIDESFKENLKEYLSLHDTLICGKAINKLFKYMASI